MPKRSRTLIALAPGGLSRALTTVCVGVILVAALAACANGGGNGQPPPLRGLSIGAPVEGQVLAGMASLVASGVNGKASEIAFNLAGQTVAAGHDGSAFLDTSLLSDGAYTLTASGIVGGEAVDDSVAVVVRNDLQSSTTVGPDGGALKSADGAIANLLPGSFDEETQLSVEDTSEQQILDRFGVDYSALGITFLGALTIEGPTGESPNLPLQVELPGWGQAVQPGQSAVMFSVLPDADGDGIGELIYAADARVAPNGSVVTVPATSTEVHGFGDAATVTSQGLTALQASVAARPGEIVTVVGRGFNAAGRLSNVARWTGPGGAKLEVLAWARVVGDEPTDPTFELNFAVPATGQGKSEVTLHNLTTGFATEPMDLEVRSLGSASAATWTAFVDQVELAVDAFAEVEQDLEEHLLGWLAALRAVDAPAAAALTGNSGLVSASNRNALANVGASPSAAQIELAARHALVLDAVAATVPAVAAPAADLATLLTVSLPADAGPSGVTAAQAGGPSCQGGGGSASTSIVIGSPTGAGSAPPGGCVSGSGAGGGAGGGPAAAGAGVDPTNSSLRAGSFKPNGRILIRLLKTDGSPLVPFVARTDASGYFNLPFVPPGEPFVLEGIDLSTGVTTRVEGVSGAVGERVTARLLLPPADPTTPSPDGFTILPQPPGPFDGTWSYLFVPTDPSSPGNEIVAYEWDFGGTLASLGAGGANGILRGYGRNGTYDVSLTTIRASGEVARSSNQFVIDDMPYDYWGEPPVRVDVSSQGLLPNAETSGGVVPSGDGRYVTIVTEASNLGPSDTNGLADLYLKDMVTGEVELISSAAPGKDVWTAVVMTPDARYIAYTEEDQPPHGTGPNRIVVVDRTSGTTQTLTNPGGFHRNTAVAFSDDGSKLLYYASTLNVADSPVWVRDLTNGEDLRLGLRFDGEGYVRISAVTLSGDGRYAVVTTRFPGLIENDDNDRSDVFVIDLETGETVRASETSSGEAGNRDSYAYVRAISADGRYVTFYGDSTNFPGGDPSASYWPDQAYLKDMQTGELELISANASGQTGDESAVLSQVSADGRYVVFGAYAYNLTPLLDTYELCLFGCPQGFSYVKDRQTGRIALVTVALNDATPDAWDQIEPQISADGKYITFYSWATNLVSGAPGTARQWYYYRTRNPLWD